MLTLRTSTLIFFAVAVVLVSMFCAKLARNPGYVLLSYRYYTLETSMLVGFLSIVLLVVLSIVGYRLTVWLFDSNWRRRMANRKTMRGLIAYAEGNWPQAEKLLSRSAGNNDAPLINFLAAAEAAHQQGKTEKRDDYLLQAHETIPGVEQSVGLAKARFQILSEQWESALATLRMLKQNPKSPGYPFVLKLLAQTYNELADWPALRDLLPELQKQQVLEAAEFDVLTQRCLEGQLAAAVRGTTEEGARLNLRGVWDTVPKKMRYNADLILGYAQRLAEAGASKEAEEVVASFLRKNWDERLVRLYGTIQSPDPAKQLQHAEGWAKEHPMDAALLLALGRLSLLNQQWEQAHRYFESSLNARKSAEACGELGRLLASLGQHDRSNEYFQQGLAMLAQRLPVLPQPKAAAATAEETVSG
ncbi:porphyrin biosynthesis protein [gamma proteobacterium HdN1]|nr:porphyrin biosynthesis protein [gamma proteobacterium HdN1]